MRERKRRHDDLHRPFGGRGKRAMPPPPKPRSAGHPKDVCYCGDYRDQHKDGTGPCVFNGRGSDACHGNEDCMSFRLHEHAPTADELAPIPGDLSPGPKRK